MITTNDLRPGNAFELDGDLYRVLTKSAHHMGRGGATVRVKMRNLRSGSTFERTFGPDVRIQDVRLISREVEYLYNDDHLYYFMDTETYQQPAINAAALQEQIPYLKPNLLLEIAFYDDEPIEIELPANVDLEVIYTEPGHAGNTAQGATKDAETETGLVVQVPLFVNIGDTIRVKTETGKYVTRV